MTKSLQWIKIYCNFAVFNRGNKENKMKMAMQCTLISRALRSKTVKVKPVSLDKLCEQLKTDEERAAEVNVFRMHLHEQTPGSPFLYVSKLPFIQPAFGQRRTKTGLRPVYQGVVLLQVADVESPEVMRRLKDEACSLPFTLLAVAGSSGRTLKILVSAKLDDGTLPKDDEKVEPFHRLAAERATRLYSSLLSLPLEQNAPTTSDSFRWTYDSDLRFMPDATPLKITKHELLAEHTDIEAQTMKFSGTLPSSENCDLYIRKFTKAVEMARSTHRIIENPQDEVMLVAKQCVQLRMPQEEAVYHSTLQYRWPSLKRSTIRALVEAVYSDMGELPARGRKGMMQDMTIRLQHFMNVRYDLRFNELTNGVEFRPNNSHSYKFLSLDSRMENTMIQEANEAGLEVLDRDMHRFLGSTRIRSYNAVKAFIDEHRDDWKGRKDHIGDLARRIPTDNPRWAEWFHTWVLAMVAQWLGWSRTHGNAVVPLLIGPQGCGKSTFGQILLPPELRSDGYRELVSFNNKEEVQRLLTTALVVNLDEFNQISDRIQQGFLKNLLQKASVKGRRPYSSVQVELPRMASFIATSNFADVLNDPSGTRRFIVATINGTDRIDTTTPIPYGQLYSQAYHELLDGRAYYFSPVEQAAIEAYNASQIDMRPEIQHFHETFVPATTEDAETTRMSLTTLTQRITALTGYRYDERSRLILGRYLAQLARSLRIRKYISRGYAQYLVSNKM